jgi:hypothetical protein
VEVTLATGRLIGFGDAAKLLQEFMPHKDARQWLLTDAQHEPVIPRILRGGQPHYDMSDLAAFVVRFLDPMAHLETAPATATIDQRMDRRRGADRRLNPPLLLAPGIERRDYSHGDRRGVGPAERGLHTMH